MTIEPTFFPDAAPTTNIDVCGGRGCCDEQWDKEHGILRMVDYQQWFPAIALFSFLGGMCCMGMASRKRSANSEE